MIQLKAGPESQPYKDAHGRSQNSLHDTTKSRPSSNHNSKKTPMEEAKIAKEAIRGRPSSNQNCTKTPRISQNSLKIQLTAAAMDAAT